MLNFIHLTDCHLLNNSCETLHEINPFESLSKIIDHIQQAQGKYDFLLVTGDISHTGTKKSYNLFNKLLNKLKKPVYCLPGNHDNPELLIDVSLASTNKDISINYIHSHALILLNSHCRGKQSGTISDHQLEQLENMLANNNLPVIVALHHHPTDIGSLWIDNIRLTNGKELISIIEKHSSVKLVLFGHAHQEIRLTCKSISLLGTPSTWAQFKPHSVSMSKDELQPGYRFVTIQNNNLIKTQIHRIKH